MDNFSKIINDHDEDFLHSFLEQVHEEISVIESNMMLIHTATEQTRGIEAVFKSIQKIESLCRVGCLDPLILFMNRAEMIITAFRIAKLPITEQSVEVFLLMIDLLRTTSEDMVKIRVLDVELLAKFGQRMEEIKIASARNENLTSLLEDTLLQYSIRVKKDVVYNAFEEEVVEVGQAALVCSLDDRQLSKFWDLADALEMRFPHWNHRTNVVLETCLLMNRSLGNVIEDRQLTAAVYLHDIGMGLLPDSIIYKNGKYDSEQMMLMQNHPYYAHNILSCIPGFEEAAEMVLQHHEWFDGSGYPAGLKYGDIIAGAQIISIADTFYSLTHRRPDRNYKKSIVRALSEINRKMGTQFDPQVVEALNSVGRQLVGLYAKRPPA